MQFRDRGSLMDDRTRVASAFSVALVLLVVFALAAAGGIAQALPVHSSQSSEIIGLEMDLSTPLTLLPSNPVGPFDAYVSPNGVWPLDLYPGETSIEAEEVPLSERMASGNTSTLIPADFLPLGVTMYLTGPSSEYEGDSVTLTVGVTATSSFPCCISGYVYTGQESDTATPGVDYFDNYRKSFSFQYPGEEFFYIPTYEDDVVEPDEYFTVVLSTYPHSSYTIVPVFSKAWIFNVDPVSASGLSVGDATVTEGDAGTTTASFTVSLAPASASTVTVDYSTCGMGCDSAATATGGDDYEIAVDSLTFAPGETSKTIPVMINGDTVVEPDEVFFMGIGGATGATITDSQGRGTIVNDDSVAANTAPVVSAGSNQTVTLPSSAALNGTVTDDGLPSGSLTSTWTKQSGPGTVTFDDAHAVDTTAGLSTSGVYVLRLTASDGALSSFDDMTVTVIPADIADSVDIVILGGASAVSASVEAQLRTCAAGSVTRLAGNDRYQTATAISKAAFASADGAYLATGFNFPDALAGGPPAAIGSKPVLLVNDAVPASTLLDLDRLGVTSVTVLGGPAVVPQSVVASLNALVPTTRIAGADRYSTAAAIVQEEFASADVVYVATGLNFPDALAGVPAAAGDTAPILLVQQDSIPGPTAAQLNRLKPTTIKILGGEAVISQGVANALGGYASTVLRLAGSDRYSTAAAISRHAFPSGASRIYVATGLNYPDALAGGPAAGMSSAPILLVQTDAIPGSTKTEIQRITGITCG